MKVAAGGKCWKCNFELGSSDYGRQDVCNKCGSHTRCCKNCDFYDRTYNNECRESQADRVVEKEKGNFCDYFTPSSRAGGAGTSKSDLKAAADALFKKPKT